MSQSIHQYVSAFIVATMYARLGEKDHALEWLEKRIRRAMPPWWMSERNRVLTSSTPIRAMPTCCAEWDCRS